MSFTPAHADQKRADRGGGTIVPEPASTVSLTVVSIGKYFLDHKLFMRTTKVLLLFENILEANFVYPT